ncbi:MAG: Holliday junction branch migration protein RuvA [Candidatus Harrisonbacteria bacterium]|nr:Holliday junction branch migration protein RuvA [Candidatus Harrisonbacteria bacterium]
MREGKLFLPIMLYSVSGIIEKKAEGFFVLQAGGLGLKILSPKSVLENLPEEGSKLTAFTHLHVREDLLEIFGFLNQEELGLFEALISVTSVGPRSAVNIMSVAKTDTLIAAINEGNTDLISKASGIGKKTAQRIALELGGKLSHKKNAATLKLIEKDSELEDTLVSLGYTKAQAKEAIKKIDPALTSFKDRLKGALRENHKPIGD